MIRFAVVGTNWITDSFIQSARQCADFALSAVYSRTPERAEEFAAKYGVSRRFTDLDELASSDAVDAVYLASPNSFHASQAVRLLRAGKHVLCEKPIASTDRELQSMIDAARAGGAFLMEAMKPVYTPNFQALEKNLCKIGRIRRYFASYCQYSSRYDRFKNGEHVNAFDPQFANGSLMDIGVYCLYPMIRLFGEPDEVLASSVKLSSGVDGLGSVIAVYREKEMDGVVMHSKISNSYVSSEIQGEEGSMLLDSVNVPKSIRISYRNGQSEEISVPQSTDVMMYETGEFLRRIRENDRKAEEISLRHSMGTLRLMETIRKQTGLVFPGDVR